MKKNITLEYIFSFISKFSITEAIWVLYLSYKGMSLAEIGLLEGIFHITSLLSEVPSGALADRMGRKKALLVSRVIGIISSSIMLFSNQLWQFGIGFVFSAWSYNLMSGTEEALVYDSCLSIGEEDEYYKVNSRVNIIIEIAQGLATFVGGAISELSFSYCYIGAIFIELLSLIPCVLFQEPETKYQKEQEKISWKEHFVISGRVIQENEAVRNIIFFYSLVFTFDTSVYFYCQKYFEEAGLHKITISIILLSSGFVACIGSYLSEAMVKRAGDKMKYIASTCMALGILGMSLGSVVLSAVCVAEISFFNAMLYPLQSASLNKRIPSEQRATIISVASMVFSCFMIILFPIMGFVGDHFGLTRTFFLTGISAILISGLLGLNHARGRD